MSKFVKYYNTVKYLKKIQIGYRLYYFGRSKYRKLTGFRYPLSAEAKSEDIKLQESIKSLKSFYKEGKRECFDFLNLSKCFESKIDWNFSQYGKLWAYNLNYFNYLEQTDINRDDALKLVYDFIEDIDNNKEGLEPYPLSLRGINWIKFIVRNGIKDQKIDDSLYAGYLILMDNLEFHVLGNHILENGLSLLFAAYYFNDRSFYDSAKEIIEKELQEEILKDGAHFELSPMYHQLILFRVLDSLNLVKNNDYFNHELEALLEKRAKEMIEWLNAMTFKNGDIPLFNDSAKFIAPTTKELKEYAKRLGVESDKKAVLKQSGYRRFDGKRYEMIVDVGNIGPDYIPGHAHSDTFNFELYIDNKPFIVDTGVSTYEDNARRFIERSTSSHNTVKIGDYEQSEIWSSFRVAKRAKIISLKEDKNRVEATHDGYKKIGIKHLRKFESYEDEIIIIDSIEKENKADEFPTAVSHLHFYPGIEVGLEENSIKTNLAKILIDGAEKIEIDDYNYAKGYNNLEKSKVVKIIFRNYCKVKFTFVTNGK